MLYQTNFVRIFIGLFGVLNAHILFSYMEFINERTGKKKGFNRAKRTYKKF